MNLFRILSNAQGSKTGDFFANEGHASLGSPSFKTNGAFLTMEQKLYNFISPSTLELKRKTLGRRQKWGGLIEVAAININQPFPTSPSPMVALARPRVHLPWPLIPSLCLMMSLPGSHANGRPTGPFAGRKSNCTSGNCLPPSPAWSVQMDRWSTHPAQCAPLIFITPFLSNRNTSPQLITSATTPWCIPFPPGVGPWMVSDAYHQITVSASQPIPHHYKFIMTSLNLWNPSYYSRLQRTFLFKHLPP